jgi:hypothetical protein
VALIAWRFRELGRTVLQPAPAAPAAPA